MCMEGISKEWRKSAPCPPPPEGGVKGEPSPPIKYAQLTMGVEGAQPLLGMLGAGDTFTTLH